MADTLIIKINDARLVVASSGRVLHVEPGFAVVDGRSILTGSDAYGRARLQPRNTSQQHWAMLSADSGTAPVDGVDSTAEIAYAQLDQLWTPYRDDTDAVVLVVPTDYSNEALGVLLGLAEECGMPVAGMVDAAVAASVSPYPTRQLVYVDAGLHSVSVTPLEQGSEVKSLDPQRLDTGLATVMDAYARRIAELFVLETRFDPLHQAATEQQVYDGLADWLEALRSDEVVPIEIQHAGETFAIQLARSSLQKAAEGFFIALQQLVAQTREPGTGLAIQLSDKVAAIPGVVEALGRLDDALIVRQEPGQGALSIGPDHVEMMRASGQVRLYRHLPWRAPAVESAAAEPLSPAVQSSARVGATHVVYGGVAYRVNGEGVTIGRADSGGRSIVIDVPSQGISRTHCELTLADGELRLKDRSSYGTFVNERRIEGEVILRPADVIRIGSPGVQLTAIRMDESAEAANGA